MKRSSKLSMIAIIFGIVLTLAISIVPFKWPQNKEATEALIIALIGLAITLIFELRVRQGELEDLIDDALIKSQREEKIIEHGQKDAMFLRKYNDVKAQIDELSEGQYRINSLKELYEDDIRSLNTLGIGEKMRSTCPISSVSLQAVLEQISDARYTASIEAHIAAAKRGAQVTRIYLFRDRGFFEHTSVKTHLKQIKNDGINVLVVFRNEIQIGNEIDFLVFGERKVSIGEIDVDSGTVRGGRIYTDRATVNRYISDYDNVALVARRLDQLS